MLRRPALVALLLCALPSPALANPSISVSATADGALNRLPAKVAHRLTLTAGATQETVAVSAFASTFEVSGSAEIVDGPSGVGPPTSLCGIRWMHAHDAYGGQSRFSVTVRLAPFATGFVDAVTTFKQAPWAADTLDATWSITPAQGAPYDVVSAAPSYSGPQGVELNFVLTRVARRVYAVAGTATSGVGSGRVQLWGYAPGRKRATRLAIARVSLDAWSIPHLRLPRSGRWEFYARYRTARKAYANDASACGKVMRVH